MTSSRIIRPVIQSDFAQWEPLWIAYNKFYERVLPLEVTEMTWTRFFEDEEPIFGLVAVENGQLMGLAHYIFHRSTSMIGNSCYLSDLYTVAPARGKGIGRALIEAVCEKAKAAGSSRVYWMTQETNSTAMVLYDKVAERSGFIQYRKQL
ncbi:MAG: GNAT family N-acetyltransferase [Candidatus Obscuribacterales bacterium]|nr:GNAT family N-acetyltransferase [Candidatus Obscuribacterales bacterium]